MRWSDSDVSTTLSVSAPPYRDVVPAPRASARLPRASLLVLDVRCVVDDCLPQAVAAARELHPTAPVILRVPEITCETLRLAHRASRMGARAVVGRDEPLDKVLRPLLTHPDDLAGDLLEWLKLRGRTFPPRVSALVRTVVELAPRYPHLSDLLHASGESERTVRHLFRCAGPPGPRVWHQGTRALRAALRLQADPCTRVQAVALDLGYSDHSGLAQQITRTFGVTPSAIRGTLGWEWLMERLLTRSGRVKGSTK